MTLTLEDWRARAFAAEQEIVVQQQQVAELERLIHNALSLLIQRPVLSRMPKKPEVLK